MLVIDHCGGRADTSARTSSCTDEEAACTCAAHGRKGTTIETTSQYQSASANDEKYGLGTKSYSRGTFSAPQSTAAAATGTINSSSGSGDAGKAEDAELGALSGVNITAAPSRIAMHRSSSLTRHLYPSANWAARARSLPTLVEVDAETEYDHDTDDNDDDTSESRVLLQSPVIATSSAHVPLP